MPELQIKLEELRKRSIFCAVPMYGGQCTGQFAKSMMDLATLATKYDIVLRTFFIFNESLITRARNYLADEFLRSDCTHMMFIDADIGFNPNDVITLLALADPESDKDIICGPYPKKVISWEKVKRAVDKGFADQNPNELERFVGDFVFNPVEGMNEIRVDQPVEVMESGTGFMMIQRKTFEQYAEAYPEYYYKPDHIRTKHFDGSRDIMCFFNAEIEPKSKRYLSEDYFFTQKARAIGLKVWLCPWMKLSHTGTYIFGGSLVDLAMAGVSATADVNEVNKSKK